MKKNLLLLLLTIILCGCTSKYELTIDGNKFSEKITTYIYSGDRENDLFDGIESGNRIDGLIEHDVFSSFGSYKNKYKKKYSKKSEYEKVELRQSYTYEEFKKSNSIMSCFHKYEFNEDKKYYEISLYDGFFCLYNNDNIDIIIKNKNKVVESTADEVVGNKYIWHVGKNNYKDLNIFMKFSKKSKVMMVFPIIIIVSFVLILGVGVVFTIMKVKKNEEV